MERGGDQVLVAAVPLRHLEAARERCASVGSVVLPAGGPGDLDDAPTGAEVLLIATDAGERDVPAVTWGARFLRRVPHLAGEPWPDDVPTTWAGEHPPSAPDPAVSEGVTDEEDDEPDLDDAVGPQSFFEVQHLGPLERRDWIFANELVPKQQRRGRTFVPSTPRLIVPVD